MWLHLLNEEDLHLLWGKVFKMGLEELADILIFALGLVWKDFQFGLDLILASLDSVLIVWFGLG